MKIKVYIIFPEQDDDFIRIGNNSENYKEIIREVSFIRKILDDTGNYEFWFDANNISEFSKKANQIVGGNYLSNISNQIRIFFGTTAKTISTVSTRDVKCVYMRLNSDFSFEEPAPIMIEAVESSLTDNSATAVVININEAFTCDRETINIIKDSKTIEDLPSLTRILVFNNDYSLKEWVNSHTSESKFSLRNKAKFNPTGKVWIKQAIYLDKDTGHYWYFDYFHKDNKIHFEVFDSAGDHLYEADENGVERPDSKSDKKKISKII